MSYTVNEADGTAVVGVAVLFGNLSREVVVRFNTMDDSATSTGTQTARLFEIYFYVSI